MGLFYISKVVLDKSCPCRLFKVYLENAGF